MDAQDISITGEGHISMQGENICGVIDVSSSQPQAEYPADFDGFIWVDDGAENVVIRDARKQS